MNVLSLFDGMACGRLALERAGIPVTKYFASEIKRHAIDLVSRRWPDTIQLGDVRKVHHTNWGIEIDTGPSSIRVLEVIPDLLIGGSPCKGISGMNQNPTGLAHDESILFWEYVRILKEIRLVNPDVKFLLENTTGQKEAINTITKILGVRPIKFNSRWVSAQNRTRYYWTNIPVNSLPKKKNITTADVFDNTMPTELICSEGRVRWLENESGKKSIRKKFTYINPFPKAGCITATGHTKWNENYILKDGKYRFLSIVELERLQTIPEGYCKGLTYDEAYDLIGDGWTVDIVAHIFSHIKK